ncbi:putative family taurine catabolism dioxygenase [Phaeomoniella chlamydospora]|uniref:Putative family taurine catabolism dioxygenase n=1 Tax=Phaeomoniella chlamydospora TaxID=158046 RepID=A0A0G2ECT4_PHACM|nr:putative family taurine catabolism dioxygenase [Phaeomoniella chlamydospora]
MGSLGTPYRSDIKVTPLPLPSGSSIDFGATVEEIDIENLSDADFEKLNDSLYNYNVLILKGQGHTTPKAQYLLTQRFDPAAGSGYGHNADFRDKKSILANDGSTIPAVPQVQLIGNGRFGSYEGLENFKLTHPHHQTFHRTVVPKEEDPVYTRFYRWHIDAALYNKLPPRVTTFIAVRLPKDGASRRQTIRWDDGTGDEVKGIVPGSTAFVSSYKTYDLLSEDQKEFARGAKIEYAPHPYVWMASAKARENGLGMHNEGLEAPDDQLPPIEKDKILITPMCWRNPVTGKLALQIHPASVKKIHKPNGEILDDLAEVRKILYEYQRPGIGPEYVYLHEWKEGDMVVWNNHGMLHAVTGTLDPDKEQDKRLFRQCNLAASAPPLGPL